MPLDIQLEPYVLESVLVRDSYLTHYQATGAGKVNFIATEFYPTYMADRLPDGTLKISERFTQEFQGELDTFRSRGNAMSEVQGAILPIEGVIDRNNTAYVVRRVCNFTTVESYMAGQKMEVPEAFAFIRPLLISLAQAQTAGVIFNFSIKDLRVTPQKLLMLDATFSWELNFNPSIVEIAKLYFKLITGHTYSKDKPNFEDYGVTVPKRLADMLSEILSGADILYGSLDDFHKRLKSVLDMEMGGATSAKSSISGRVLNIAAIFLFVLVMLGLGGLVYGGLVALRASNRWASTDRFADATITRSALDYSHVAVTHPRNTGDTLEGSFHKHYVFIYFRSDWGRPVLARRQVQDRALQMPGLVATEEEFIFIDNVQPSFINSWTVERPNERRQNYIFFADGLENNAIYRASLDGTERNLTRVFPYTAMHLIVVGDNLFFSNYDHNNYLYRIDLKTMRVQIALAMPFFTPATDGEYLYFFSGTPGEAVNLYMLHPDYPTAVTRLAMDVGNTLRYRNEMLFFNDANGHVHQMTTEGEPVNYWDEIVTQSFTLDRSWLIFTEPGIMQPRMMHLGDGERFTLDATHWLAYIWAYDGVLYGIDHINHLQVHMLQLP